MPATRALLEKLFAPFPVPSTLLKLLAFQESVGYGTYSQALSLDVDERLGLIHGWSSDLEFLRSLFPFAMANGSGSFYALWNMNQDASSSEWPVVVFGDEGGEWVVAQNLAELLALAANDTEPMVGHSDVLFYRDPEDSWSSSAVDEFVAWLRVELEVNPASDMQSTVANAQAKLQARFNAWKAPFLEHYGAA